MKRLLPALAAASLLLALSQGLVLAADPAHIDAEQTGVTQNDGGHTFAQTIAVGHAGSFSSVDLWLGGGGSVTVDIEAVDGSDHPTGSPLATGTATAPTTPGWVNFTFTVPLSVTIGQHYAIVFAAAGAPYAYGSNSDFYGPGAAYWFDTVATQWKALGATEGLPVDLGFRTYVDPPVVKNSPTVKKTPAPTSSVDNTPSGGSSIVPLLPIGLLTACGGMMLVIYRRRSRLS
jgi:hypothetical protein